jgi:asparagine synthase (glutamine-hydrolysing)
MGVEIALPLHFACSLASEHGYKYVFNGQGADELFAGYSRYERILKKNNYQYLHEILFKDVLNLWHHDIIRDDKISMGNSIEIKMPYLDLALVKFGLSIPPEFKLKQTGNNFVRKYILKTLGKRRGLDKKLLNLPKVAVQYGSGASKGLKRIGMRLGIDNEHARALGFSNTIDALTNIVFSDLGYSKNSTPTIPENLLSKVSSWK